MPPERYSLFARADHNPRLSSCSCALEIEIGAPRQAVNADRYRRVGTRDGGAPLLGHPGDADSLTASNFLSPFVNRWATASSNGSCSKPAHTQRPSARIRMDHYLWAMIDSPCADLP